MEIGKKEYKKLIANGVISPSGKKREYWIPYVQEIKKLKREWFIIFQGGEIVMDLKNVSHIMFYGKAGELPIEFLLETANHNIGITIHSSHAKKPVILSQQPRPGKPDILSKQIAARNNTRKRLVVAKALIHARLGQMAWLLPSANDNALAVQKQNNLDELRLFEAQVTKHYWRRYFSYVGHSSLTRRESNPITLALNNCITLMISKITRWIIFHRLSVSHGFLHEPTTYESLAYDFIEPIRHWIEQDVAQAVIHHGLDEVVPRSLKILKSRLSSWVEVPSLQVTATHKNIIHGHVLALRAYLNGDMQRLNLPIDGKERSRGRPVKVSYKIPGEKKRQR